MSTFLALFVSFAAAQDNLVASVTDFPCNRPVQGDVAVNINAIAPSITGDRRYMMERGIALEAMQAQAAQDCTRELASALATVEMAKADADAKRAIAEATAAQIKKGGVVKTTSTGGGDISTSTQEAALVGGGYGYGGTYIGSIEDTRTRVQSARQFLKNSQGSRPTGTPGGGNAPETPETPQTSTTPQTVREEDPAVEAIRRQHEKDVAEVVRKAQGK